MTRASMRSPTHAETAQRVLDTPGLVTRLAEGCVAASPTLSKLDTIYVYYELHAVIRAELERIAAAGPHFAEEG